MKKILIILSLIIITTFSVQAATNRNIFGAVRDSVNDEYARVVDGALNTNSKSFNLNVAMGDVDGYSHIDKFGVNLDITGGGDEEDVWEFGGDYNYDAVGTAPIKYLSSSSSADTGQTINITGLDINGIEISQELTTNGQNIVNLTTPLWRVYRMQNISDDGGDLTGMLYCHTDATPTSGVPDDEDVRAIIDNGNNQTLMTLYTVPAGKVGFLIRGEAGLEDEGNSSTLAEFAHCHYKSRRSGKLFTIKKAVTLIVGGTSIYVDNRSFPDIIPSLTDIKLSCYTSQTMGVWGTFDVMLVDEEDLTTEFLQSINQTGY